MSVRRLLLTLLLAGACGASTACSGDGALDPTAALDCDPGAFGCACARGDVCGTSPHGAPMRCDRGLCVPEDCPAGGGGCLCAPGAACASADDECRDGVCRARDCGAGTTGCECVAGACGLGLWCDVSLGGGTCVDGTGFPGGPCPDTGACRGASRCDPALSVCVPCTRGSLGCEADEGRCAAGLVLVAGRCAPPPPQVPEDPKCWTRCRADLSEGTFLRSCGADGLMEGCAGGKTCVEGSCVEPGSQPPACSADPECPDFQTCIAGQCYSTCELDSECGGGAVCHLRVCRAPCQRSMAAADTCPTGTYCESGDGSSGICMPLAAAGGTTRREVFASFTVSSDALTLGPAGTVRSFSLEHDGHLPETFEVRRASERAFDSTGAIVSDVRRGSGTPLGFLELRVGGVAMTQASFEVTVPPGCGAACPVIEVVAPGELPDARWTYFEGTIEVHSETLGSRYIRVEHRERPDGRWAGRAHYFASFPDGGLAELLTADDRGEAAALVQNGLLRRWSAFRRGRLAGGLHELRAVMQATEEESWRWPSVQEACPLEDGACYLYATSGPGGGATSGVVTYVPSLADAPIPTGHSELEIALHVRTSTADATRMVGRIDSRTSLHLLGDPAVSLAFSADPSDPASCAADGIPGACVVFLEGFGAQSTVGGRVVVEEGSACPAGLSPARVPWLVPGFLEGSSVDLASGSIVKTECRDGRFPHAAPSLTAENASLAGANPIPDGRPRRRSLRLLDGALVDGETLVIFFEERFESFLGTTGAASFPAYGYMVLERDSAVLNGADYAAGAEVPVPAASEAPGPSCSESLVRAALDLDPGSPLPALDDAPTARAVVDYVLDGRTTGASDLPLGAVHYYCEDTGLFDGGPSNPSADGSGDVRIPCPLGSNVRYFAFPTGLFGQADIAALACQQGYNAQMGARGSCGAQLDIWAASGLDAIVLDLPWSCTGDLRYCSEDRLDLRAGKRFYLPSEVELLPLPAAIDDAFRYRIRFATRSGGQVGFAPQICENDGSNRTPYCYAPRAIEELRARIDCLLSLSPGYRALSSAPEHAASADRVEELLSQSFGAIEVLSPNGGIPSLRDGFERLHAELLVMLGDEAYTQAFRSRFDLAALHGAAFRGSEHERGGIDLTGVAGFELASLYQAAQYYQLALDRFYGVAPLLARAIDAGNVGSPPRLVTPATVTWYLDRLIRGSTQRARTWSAIAQRYQGFNRPDLARRVLERAYAATHLEAAVLGRMMVLVERRSSNTTRDEIIRAIELAQRRYRVALQEMRAAYQAITDQTTLFGYAPDYVPFPVRDDRDFRSSNGFEDVFNTAREYVETARRLEDTALTSSRDFDVDAASFQAELVRIAQTYEGRLAPICGQFVGRDGYVHPATARHAYLDDGLALLGDPCGLAGNGDIHEQLGQLELLMLRKQALNARNEHLQAEIEDELRRVEGQCDLIQSLADFEYTQGQQVLTLESRVRTTELVIGVLDRYATYFATGLQLIRCSTPTECGIAAAQAGGWAAYEVPHIVAAGTLQNDINQAQREISELHLETARWRTESECTRLQLDSAPIVAGKVRQLAELALEAQQIMLELRLAQSRLEELHLEAGRIQDEQAEAEQLAINVEAVRNDPNVRLYKNDAIINADRAFELALRHVYRATRVYEYYTSTSYGALEQLFLARMVSRGDHNLERYLSDLRDAFLTFEETFRAPAARVERLSVRDHVFAIPYLDASGDPLSVDERNRLFRERLLDPRLLDANGHLAIPFATTPELVAPCTRNHKLDFIELSLIGGNLGDDEADVLLWQNGTGVVEALEGQDRYYRLPPALIVAQPYFGRTAVFDPAVYRRYELRERPFLNTSWSLVLNQRDNPENQDIDLARLDDVVIYLYYTDFTDPRSCGR